MNWDALDYVVFGAMVAAVTTVYVLARQTSGNRLYRYGIGVALAAAFILIWVNAAVGIIGNENNDVNMLYFGVVAIGVIGALLARFRAPGMARAMIAAAIAQALIALVAIVGDMGSAGPAWPKDVLVLTVFFVALWLVAARLFQLAAKRQSQLS